MGSQFPKAWVPETLAIWMSLRLLTYLRSKGTGQLSGRENAVGASPTGYMHTAAGGMQRGSMRVHVA